MQAQNPAMTLSTVGQLISDLARAHGTRVALTFPELGAQFTFSDLDLLATAVAKNLYRRGFRKGDRLAVWANNIPEWIILQFATARIGVVIVTVNTGLRRHELKYLLNQCEARGLALVRSFRGIDFVAELEAVRGELPHLHEVFVLPDDFGGLSAATPDPLPKVDLRPDECINMQYTSGTTGFPKGVMLSHRNILKNGFDLGSGLRFSPDDSLCLTVPLFHCFGCVIGVLGAYTHAATIVALTEFNPERVLDAVHNHRCTVLYGVPTMFIAELNHPNFGKYNLSSLRTGIMAGAPCPRETMKAVVEKMGAREMTIAYGLTEASPGVTLTAPDDSLDVRVSTVGRVLPDVEIKLVDPVTKEDLPAGREGELATRGYHVMLGYYNMPEETRTAIRDGWLMTGDLATIDEQGYVRITGRSKDLIIRAGENIAPREIEEVLLTHPDIVEAYAYGVPSEFFGQQVAAAIRLKPNARPNPDGIRQFCVDRMAKFKAPEFIEFVDSFPTTPSGKVQKYKLAESWLARQKAPL